MKTIGLNLTKSGFSLEEITVQRSEELGSFTFILEFILLSFNNGNGSYRIKICDRDGSIQELELSGWTLYPFIYLPFNWRNTRAVMNIKDPDGLNRKVEIVSKPVTIFKNREGIQDSHEILKTFLEIAVYSNWGHYDFENENSSLKYY